ncbi:MAG: VCBS repeat-containing protein [Proteobacteria bacterium]|nr:VCBS repeat-containing protein [Pseudomonadota bacterium]
MKAFVAALFGILISGLFLGTEFISAAELRYIWEQQYYGMLNGGKSLLFSHEMRASKLAFADIDGDGDKDIFVGQQNGEIAYFENQGTRHTPDFVLITQQYKAIFEIKKTGRKVKIRNVIDVGGNSAPSLVDIDNDKDFDLFIGSEEGNIWYFENLGNNLIPVFRLVTPKYAGINSGRNSVPLFADINLKRKFDLLVGTVEGMVWLYLNEGTRKKADFQAVAPQKVVEFGLETHAAPGLFDWDDDGDLDLLVGQKNGTLSLYLNKGDIFSPNWVFTEQNFQLIDIGGESSPYFVDINGDGEADMVIGSANPTAFLYESRHQDGKRTFWNVSTNLFKFHKLIVTGSRASLAAGDLDGDGDLDLIVGENAGNLNFYENQSTSKVPNWVLATEELIYMTGIQNSAPTLGDIDGDGDLDLLVGARQGQIALVSNEGTPQKPLWLLKDQAYFQIDVGSNSVPRLLDMDGDGDLDLMIGNFAGRTILYLNKGSRKEPMFVVESTRFASAKVTRNAVPAFFDWNNDTFGDMILGSEEGKVQVLMAPGKLGEESTIWEVNERALHTFDVYSRSHPIMNDFDGDGQPDLLLGNDFGDFLLYLNKGTEVTEEETKIVVDNSIDQQEGSLVVEEVEGPVEIEIETEDVEEASEEEELELTIAEEEMESRIKIEPRYVKVHIPLIQNETLNRSVPTFGDLDQDGDLDLLVGSLSGAVYFYENQGNEAQWSFKLVSNDYIQNSVIRNSTPLLHDLDQDGDLDLVVGSKNGRLSYYGNQGSSERAKFVLEPDFFRNVWLSKNSKPAMQDLNGDGLIDLLVGNFIGKLVFIRNDSNRFIIVRRDYKKIDVVIGSTPFFADLNNSGINELIVGSDSGSILFFRNQKEDLQGEWQTIPKYGRNLSFPQGSSPVVVDLDGDGDLDLITGTESGTVILYRNDAIVMEEETELQLAEG